MERLSNKTLADAQAWCPTYDREKLGIGIVHFGPGAFHRAHQAFFTDQAIAKSGGNWGICGVSLNSRGAAETLTPQDGLYTIAIKDKLSDYRIIGALKEVLCAKDDPKLVLERLTASTTKFVTLTITEKGYALNAKGELDLENAGIAADLQSPEAPSSAIGYLVRACGLRREAGTAPLTIISCDNLPDNGHKLLGCCTAFANEFDAELASYISESVRFPNTMVDSITPATDASVRETVANAIGFEDAAPVQREAFTQWVIEDNLPADRPDWAAAGAIITSDVAAFEKTKLRILNGAHSTLTYLGLLAGLETVEDAINHEGLRGFVDALIKQETIPTIQAPEGLSLEGYWGQIQARFENPHIRHLLEQISHDGSQKIPARIFPVIEFHAENGGVPNQACFVVASWIEFNRQRRKVGNLPIDGYLSQIAAQLPDADLPPREYAEKFLGIKAIIPATIARNSASVKFIVQACSQIAAKGVIASLPLSNP